MRHGAIVLVVLVVAIIAVVFLGRHRACGRVRPSPGVASAPATPAAPETAGGPLVRDLGADPPEPSRTALGRGGVGADELRFRQEAASALASMAEAVERCGVPALLESLSETALSDDARGFERAWMALRWRLGTEHSDWALIEGFALDVGRPELARRAALRALAASRGTSVRDTLIGWFRDPRFAGLRGTLLDAVVAAETESARPIEEEAREMLLGQARNAGAPAPLTEPGSPQTPKSREALELVIGVAESEAGTDASRRAFGILGSWLCETYERRAASGEGLVEGDLLDARSAARVSTALMRAASDASWDEVERSIALDALGRMEGEEVDRFWITAYEASSGEERTSFASEAGRRVALRQGWGAVERMIASEPDDLARGCLLAAVPAETAHPPEMLAWLERELHSARDPWLRCLAIEKLACLWPASRAFLREAVSDADTQVSQHATAVWERLEQPEGQ